MAPIPPVKQPPQAYVDQSPATPGQIALYAKGAGIPDDQVPTAVAIALAESGGKLAEIGGPNSDGSYDLGLWQINSRAHPSLFVMYPDWWESSSNARMMAAVWNGRGGSWEPWTAFRSGAYREFLPVATQGAEQPATGENTGVVDTQITILQDAADTFASLTNGLISIAQSVFKGMVWVATPHNWARVLMVATGGALVVGALVVVSKPTTSLTQAVTAAPRAAGRAAVKPVAAAVRKVS